jgi:hypothetical protein
MATPEEVAAEQQTQANIEQQSSGGTQTPPATPPAGESEAEAVRKEKLALEERYNNLVKDHTKKSQELADLKKSQATTVKYPESTNTDAIDADRRYLNELGYLTREQVEAELTKRENDRENERKIRDRAENIRNDMKKATSEYKFINEDDLLNFMKARPGLSVTEAAKLKYEEEFDKLKNKTSPTAPETDNTGRGGVEPPVRKLVKFSDRKGIGQAIAETARNVARIE